MQSRYDRSLQAILDLQHEIAGIHPMLERAFPIALVEDGQFYIYDLDASGRRYEYVQQAPTPMPVPQGVRAAFPLACYGDRPACVVTGEVFDSLAGYVTIFHEFVHCQQSETCEAKLKQTLGIARKAQAENDVMLEIHYPFPYADPPFVETYATFLAALEKGAANRVAAARQKLHEILCPGDLEYVFWQEWKEGLARYVENRIRCRLGLEGNHGGSVPPFDRVVFYEGGARWIAFLADREPSLLADIEKLFHRMRGAMAWSRSNPAQAAQERGQGEPQRG